MLLLLRVFVVGRAVCLLAEACAHGVLAGCCVRGRGVVGSVSVGEWERGELLLVVDAFELLDGVGAALMSVRIGALRARWRGGCRRCELRGSV